MADRRGTFSARVEPVPGGGHFVRVPAHMAVDAGLKYRDRVRGTVDGVFYQSSLMQYSGVFHLGLHNATLKACGRDNGDIVQVSMGIDPNPPGDTEPPALARAMAAEPRLRQAWNLLAPSRRREHVKHIEGAKRPETRDRRLAGLLKELRGESQ